MEQIIRNPTHEHGNILDLAFVSQAEAWDYELLNSKFSDHTPVLLTYSATYIPCNNLLSEYSLSSFDETAFLQSLNIDSPLPNSPINGNSNQCFSLLWLSNFQNALSSSLTLKRKKRHSSPFVYSSLTVHYLNKLETARRRKACDIAIRELENEVSQFIELDKASFLISAKFFSTNDAFKLLKRLSGRPSLPNRVYWKDTEAETVLATANLFNQSIPNSRTVLFLSVKKPPRIFFCQKFVLTVISYASYLEVFRQVPFRLVTVFHHLFIVLVPNFLHLMFILSSALSYEQLAGHYSENLSM